MQFTVALQQGCREFRRVRQLSALRTVRVLRRKIIATSSQRLSSLDPSIGCWFGPPTFATTVGIPVLPDLTRFGEMLVGDGAPFAKLLETFGNRQLVVERLFCRSWPLEEEEAGFHV